MYANKVLTSLQKKISSFKMYSKKHNYESSLSGCSSTITQELEIQTTIHQNSFFVF